MEESSAWHEEERRATFYVYHPCDFLQEALRALLKCLGIESSQPKQERSSSPQTHAAEDPTANSPTNTQRSIDAADPPSNAILLVRRDGSRRSPINLGPGPKHN